MSKINLETEAREHLQNALGQMMSDVSEETYSAGWLDKLEEDLPRAIHKYLNSDEPTGWAINEPTAKFMYLIAKTLGYWVDYKWDKSGEWYEPYTPKVVEEHGWLAVETTF